MKKFKLYYTKLLKNAFFRTKMEFATHAQMIDYIDEQCINRKRVWLLYKRDCEDIFISESHLSIQNFLEKKMTWQTTGDYFLEEYETYREAYDRALEIIENE
jgi:hypothetical protein